MRHLGEPLELLFEQVHELCVPRRVVEAGALAVHLVRKPAGGDDRHADVFRVALDAATQRLPEPEAAPRGGNRELKHADLQRHDRHRPLRAVRHHHRQRREDPVIERAVLEKGHVELVGHQGRAQCAARPGCPFTGGSARPAAFVGNRKRFADAERERGIVVEKERRDGSL